MQEKLFFRPRAQLLLQLGEQLIRNESIAVLELIKNAYDADAKKVTIGMDNIDTPESGIISILDDGIGMDSDIIKNIWMEPGNSHKRKLVEGKKRSLLGRLPIGEKGIGRFGVHKLGKKIELISKMKDKKEVRLFIDWERFETANYLNDVLITVEEREPEVFLNDKTGTKIIISNLATAWTRGMLRNVYRAITTLNSPFTSNSSFKVKFNTTHGEWLKGLLTFDEIKDFALYYTKITLSDNKIKQLDYNFRPYDNMKELSYRNISLKDIFMERKDHSIINLEDENIGEITIKMYVFDRTPTLLKQYIPDNASFKSYLNENGGLSVYRDDLRIYNYGEPDNDWLGFDIKRVNRPGDFISNNLILGAVFLTRGQSEALQEKANREGFIENKAYNLFKDAINFAVERFVTERNIDKINLRTAISGGLKEPVSGNVSELRQKLDKYIPDKKIRKEVDDYLVKIEEDYNYIKQIYVKTASAGMSYGVVIHEIEKIIKELNKAVKIEKASDKVKSLAQHLSRLVENYAELLRNRAKEVIPAVNIIKQALFSIKYRLEVHEVQIIDEFSNKDDICIKCSSNLVVGSIINIIDNSIWWTETAKRHPKKVLIKLSQELDGFVSIVIADNGHGFTLAAEDMIKPFVSTKPGGIGIGLNIVNEIMLSQGGKLAFPDIGDVDLPEEFENGAVVSLCFKEGVK